MVNSGSTTESGAGALAQGRYAVGAYSFRRDRIHLRLRNLRDHGRLHRPKATGNVPAPAGYTDGGHQLCGRGIARTRPETVG